MLHLKKILFPVDLSEYCLGAARYVIAMAEQFRTELVLLHVVEGTQLGTNVVDPVTVRRLELQQFLSSEFAALKPKRVVLEGDAAEKIIELSATEEPNLIMMPTRGWGGMRTLHVGSVTASVVRHTEVPVWTCATAENAPRRQDISTRKVLCALDLKARSLQVLEWSRDLASACGAELVVCHVASNGELGEVSLGAHPTESARVQAAVEALEELCKQTGVSAIRQVRSGGIAEQVCQVAQEVKADVITIGRCINKGILGRFRSHAHAIVRQARCPVISV